MHYCYALQSGTSHNFGDGFARAFGIQYADRDNKLQYVHQTSWGFTTRMIGAIIMVHGDDSGLVLPPRIAPVQCMIVPIRQDAEGVMDTALALQAEIKESGVRVRADLTDKSPGWKFSEQEMRGIPERVELGPKDVEKRQAVIVRRDNGEKQIVPLSEVGGVVKGLMDTIQNDMFARAKAHRDSHIFDAHDYDEFKDIADNRPGFIRAMWCGDQACEDKIKEDTSVTSRCIPFAEEVISDKCVCCGRPAKHMLYWGKAY